MNTTEPLADVQQAPFDAERAAHLRSSITDSFDARSRKLWRRLCIWLLICGGFAGVLIVAFFQSDDIKLWIFTGILFLVMFTSTILMKLWYWVVNSKLGILKELKLLRFDLAQDRSAVDALEAVARIDNPARVSGVSRLERFAWTIAIAVVWASPFIGHDLWIGLGAGETTRSTNITLKADGSGTMETSTEYLLLYRPGDVQMYSVGSIPAVQLIPANESPYTDGFGRRLAFRREPAGPNHRDVIPFAEPGQRHFLTETSKINAQREGDHWKFTTGLTTEGSRQHNRYSDTVTLPPGAVLVSAEPAPVGQEVRDDAIVLHFYREGSPNQSWKYIVTYRLPEATTQATSQPAAK